MGNTSKTIDGGQGEGFTVSKGYVIMLDVLGFREYISKVGMSRFLDFWKELKVKVSHTCDLLENKVDIPLARFATIFMSDTIVICVSSREDLNVLPEKLFPFVSLLLDDVFMFSFKQSIFFRGAISFGNIFCDMQESIAMGDALDEAYEWHESTDWIGVITTPSAKYALDRLFIKEPIGGFFEKEISDNFIQYLPPYKSNINFETYAYKWVKKSDDIISDGIQLSQILKLLSNLKYTISITKKYENTIDFIRHILDFDVNEYRIENTRIHNEMQKLSITDNS